MVSVRMAHRPPFGDPLAGLLDHQRCRRRLSIPDRHRTDLGHRAAPPPGICLVRVPVYPTHPDPGRTPAPDRTGGAGRRLSAHRGPPYGHGTAAGGAAWRRMVPADERFLDLAGRVLPHRAPGGRTEVHLM